MNFIVVGAGAVGGYVGASLAAAGHPVTFLARAAAAAGLRANGLQLTFAQTGAQKSVRDFRVIAALGEAASDAAYDCAIIATKTFDTAAAAESLLSAVTVTPAVLCLQNGVDGETELAAIFGAERVIAGSLTTPVSKPGPSELIIEKSRGLGIALGHPLSLPLVSAMNGAGIPTRPYPAAGPMKWSKLLTNMGGNATAAILDMPVAAIFADPRLFAVEIASLRECLAVMAAHGYAVVDLPRVPVRALALAVRYFPAWLAQPILRHSIGAGRGDKKPSMLLDLEAARPRTEIGWLHGAVARHGRNLGVPAPVNQTLADILKSLASGALDRAAFRQQPSALLARIPA